MALIDSAISATIQSVLTGKGFVLDGKFSRVNDAVTAIAGGVTAAIHQTAKVIVPVHAGGTFNVVQLSNGVMESEIISKLTANSIVSGPHSQPFKLAKAIATATSLEILSKCNVTIPVDGAGIFQVIGLDESTLDMAIRTQAQGNDFILTGKHAKTGDFINACAVGITQQVNALACVSGAFAGGGVFPVL